MLDIIELKYPHSLNRDELPKTVAAIGFFDGVHLGHQKVIQSAINYAKKEEMKSAMITFHPHPSVVLKGNTDVKYLTPLQEKEKFLRQFSLDRLYVISFTEQLSKLLPKKFIYHFIYGLNIQHLVAGFDFTYGYRGKGNMQNIQQFSKDLFTYSTIPEITYNDQKISSSNIRTYLAQGAVEKVTPVLGRPYSFEGTVIKGDQRGRQIGYPTANLTIDSQKLLPKIGVYAVHVRWGQEVFHGMLNIGVRPTFTDDLDPSIEVHILDFDEDLYGEQIQIELLQFIRPEKKFSNIDAIVQQLKSDEEAIRNFLKNYKENSYTT